MALNPCLYFTGNAEEALECYRGALGGEIQIHRYKDAPPGQPVDKGWEQKVLYGAIASPLGTVACMDAPPGRAGKPGNNFSISIEADTEAQAETAFAKLSEGGEVTMPMTETFFAEKFGMVDDKFGITWMIRYGARQVN